VPPVRGSAAIPHHHGEQDMSEYDENSAKKMKDSAEVVVAMAKHNPFWADLSDAFKEGKEVIITLHLKGGVTLSRIKVREVISGRYGAITGKNIRTHTKVSAQLTEISAYEIEVH
jgi:hypothetical protein